MARNIDRLSASFTRRLYLPAVDLARGIPMRATLKEASANAACSTDELADIQLRHLRNLVRIAYDKTPFYRSRFDARGAEPNDVRGIDDLAALPLLSKADIFDERSRMMVPGAPAIECTTSGSTGVAMSFAISPTHAAWVEACVLRARRAWGLRRGDKEVVLWARAVDDSPTKDLRAWLKYRLRNRHQHDTFVDFTDERLAALVAHIRATRARVLYGYGSSLGRVAEFMSREGLRLSPEEAPTITEFTADHMSLAEQEMGRIAFGSPVLSNYGASEVASVGLMCPAGSMHVQTDNVVVEVIRPDETPCDAGEIGELVLTSLHNRTMPLIRYRIGDAGALLAGRCDCGSPFPRMTLATGKAIELIETSAVRGTSAHLFDYINLLLMKMGIRGVRQFFVEQTALDSFTVMIVRDTVFNEKAVDVFLEKMKSRLGAQIDVVVRFVEDVPRRASGKRMYFRRTF